MNTLTAPSPRAHSPHAPASARTVLALLQHLRHGSLTLHLPDGRVLSVGQPQGGGIKASLHLHNWRPFAAALKSGDIGFAESFIAGDCSSPHLPALLSLLLANRERLQTVIHGSWAGAWVYRLRHLLRRNTKANSRKNIHAHYDLGNDFYRLWLDETMNYSSAWFGHDPRPRAEQDLSAAQNAKVRRALHMAGVRRGHRVLEIGCGWGALAEKACAEFGAQVTGVTLSHEQLQWAQQRLARQGLAAQADLRLQDYRDIDDGPYDAVCSIEMLEAVGQAYWPTYFEHLARLLKRGARACIQTIVIRDELFARYVRSTDFIQQYIFPGGCLPSPSQVRQQAQAAGLQVIDEMAFGGDYAETCRRWRADFMARKDEVLRLQSSQHTRAAFDERFMRTWEFYLAYCEAGFDAGDIDVVQFTLARP